MNLTDYLTDTPWKAKAACRDLDYRIFFPDRNGTSGQRAKRICAGCAVREPCLDEALTHSSHYDFGIFGGTNARERRALRKRRAA